MLPKSPKASYKAMIFYERRRFPPSLFCMLSQTSTMATDSSSPAASSKIQILYELCRKNCTPSGSSPLSSEAISTIRSLIDTFSPADVGLKEENPDDDSGAQPITYLSIYEGESFSICIFCLPISSYLPLHDHPGMTVFSKVLYGSVLVKAYDWIEPSCLQEIKGHDPSSVKLAKLAVDKVLMPSCGTSVLYPKTGGNLHRFTSVTPCAVLDVLTPPYRQDTGCPYYIDYPYSTFPDENEAKLSDEKDNYAWLAEKLPSKDLSMRAGEYVGPAIQV